MSELNDGRLALQAEIARLEAEVRKAEEAAAAAMAAGKATDKAMAGLEKPTAAVRIARLGLAAVERAMQDEKDVTAAARRREAQEAAVALDADALHHLLELRGHLLAAVAAARELAQVRERLAGLGMVTKHGAVGVRVAPLETALGNLDRHFATTLDADALRPLGLAKPTTPRELAILDTTAAIGGNVAALAALKQQLASSESPSKTEKAIAAREATDETLRAHLARLKGETPPALTRKERRRQLEALGVTVA